MLEDEDVYERPAGRDSTPDAHLAHGPVIGLYSSQDEVEAALRLDPDYTLHQLTHLPVELPALELWNGLLASKTLDGLVQDTSTVVCDFIQHGLRGIESALEPYDGSPTVLSAYGGSDFDDELGSGDDDSRSSRSSAHAVLVDRSADGQGRIIRLMVLFVRNLLRKRLVDQSALFFELQELCVRYLWVPEVRDLRAALHDKRL